MRDPSRKVTFRKVLVANRGEIALRVIRTLRALGIGSVAVHSDADEAARHVAEADEAVRIGPPPARESYLSIPALVGAARTTGADAVHPGYGFLSENAAFARALAKEGIVFVGPPAEVLEASEDKLQVKRRVAAAGVPVIPGPLDPVAEDPKALLAAARATGFPLLLKAAGGGGGKGMRRVDREADLSEAAEGARREAGSAFGKTDLYLERLVEGARHVEVQVLCDAHGGVAVLGERDCSVQRRHQKVIEESPAPGLSAEARSRLHDLGAKAAHALGYRNAGTAEFLLAADGAFFFLEMNRRLQVEHPVTEACFGVDLVAWQLRIAAGERVPAAGFLSRGHAVEARVYAEDPYRGFLPSTGKVLALREPEGPGIRVDSALELGAEVSPHYDPLLAKVIAHGESRDEAIRRLDLALRETVVLGVRTNVGFLRDVLADTSFRRGDLSTDLLDRRGDALLVPPEPTPEVLAAVERSRATSPGGSSPWHEMTGFRLSQGESAEERPPRRRARATVVRSGPTVLVSLDGRTYEIEPEGIGGPGHHRESEEPFAASPMTGVVVKVAAAPGAAAAAGAPLFVVEAMKMEFVVRAPRDVVVGEVRRKAGDKVALGEVVVTFADET